MVERTEDGKLHPYVMDFGLARETAASDQSRSGVIEGTPRYMAPEQARGDTQNLDRRTDVYALGVTLYELLAGRSPYDGTTTEMDVLLAVLTNEPKPLRSVNPNIPEDLEAITHKCIEKEPAARYDSAKALAEDLGRYLDGEPVRARRIGLPQRLFRHARKHKALFSLASALLLSLLGLLAYGVRTRLQSAQRELLARQQADLAQHLGQEVSKMDWLLRSARQLPLHDLSREKSLIRKRMALLHSQLLRSDSLSQGLAHYALGRGYLALHEYPSALSHLQSALSRGYSSPELHYALGFVQGKLFEQALYEARLSGGGDWAHKQLQLLEPTLLSPALSSLERSRAMKLDSPDFLEALIAFYQRSYPAALSHAAAALVQAPWLYEALKLSADIHLELALQARDSGRYDQAEREFSSAVSFFTQASSIGQSDSEVYEGLAEAWVRQIEMAATRGLPTQSAYSAALAASDKLSASEPSSPAAPLKRAFAALMTMALTGSGVSSLQRVERCLAEAKIVLDRIPLHPYASDVAAGCHAFAADAGQAQGIDPEPHLRQALALLEPAVQRFPHFLWGLNDLSNVYITLALQLQLRGKPGARELLERSLQYSSQAIKLDGSYLTAFQNQLFVWAKLLAVAPSVQEIQSILTRADELFASCTAINSKFQQCFLNYFIVYARAAERTLLAGADPGPALQRALSTLAQARALGGQFLDLEQYSALAFYVRAADLVRRKLDPSPALSDFQSSLSRCLSLSAHDALCSTLSAQSEWLRADSLLLQGKPPSQALSLALSKALSATQSPEPFPDSWCALASTYLRLSQSPSLPLAARLAHLASARSALSKVWAINPNHALGRATLGSLELLSAQLAPDASARTSHARAAVEALQRALSADPLLSPSWAAALSDARRLAQ